MRRGGVGVGVLRVFIGKVYAEAVAWRAAFGELLAGRGDLLDLEAGAMPWRVVQLPLVECLWPPGLSTGTCQRLQFNLVLAEACWLAGNEVKRK